MEQTKRMEIRLPKRAHTLLQEAASNYGMPVSVYARLLIVQSLEGTPTAQAKPAKPTPNKGGRPPKPAPGPDLRAARQRAREHCGSVDQVYLQSEHLVAAYNAGIQAALNDQSADDYPAELENYTLALGYWLIGFDTVVFDQ